MLLNKLALILAERQLKITKVSNDTGISRTTLTALNQNESKMIQIETINTLCKYFNITPCDFFEFTPVDVTFSFDLLDSLVDDKDLLNGHPVMTEAIAYLNPSKNNEKYPSLEFNGRLTDYGSIYENAGSLLEFEINIDDSSRESALLITSLPMQFQSQILKEFKLFIQNAYSKAFPNEQLTDIKINFF